MPGSVFINCPYDEQYQSLLRPMIYTLMYLGLTPRLASDNPNAALPRMAKITGLIGNCQYGIHDISRMASNKKGELARFNMPFELGVDYGCRQFSGEALKDKKFLVLDSTKYRYHKALSDYSGFDIEYHSNDATKIPGIIRNWLIDELDANQIKGPTGIWYSFIEFQAVLHDKLINLGHSEEEIKSIGIPEFRQHVETHLT